MNSKGVIVCVDDERSILVSLRDQLHNILEQGYSIELAESSAEALELFAELTQDGIEVPLVICDQTMPDGDGVTLLTQLHHQFPETLKILLTGSTDLNTIIQAVNHASLYRYIAKPWDETDLGLTVRAALRSYERDQQLMEQNARLQQMNAELQREISDRRRIEAQLAHDALHDGLTGLPNRTLFMQRIEQALQRIQACPDHKFAVLFIDLDRFKVVNDSLGHTTGDQLLIAIAQRLQYTLRHNSLAARLGGDEFTVLLDNITSITDSITVAERILETLNRPFRLQEHTLFISASIGIVCGTDAYSNSADLLRDADLAMYEAKKCGKARYALFNQELHTQSLRQLQLESGLHQALNRQEFVLYYQPIVSLNSGHLTGFEALVRWQHPELGMIPPSEFIPVAEETGFITSLGAWVLDTACRQLKSWQAQFPDYQHLSISVNLSEQQLRDPNLLTFIDQVLEETQISGQSLKLELTESMLIDDAEVLIQTLHSIRARKIQLSIDDFGTGYSSLSYLPRFPINTLKIDRVFVQAMTTSLENLEVVRAIATLAHSLGINVVAEGLETPEQMTQLQALECELGQGYLFAKPLSPAGAEKLLQLSSPFPTTHASHGLLTPLPKHTGPRLSEELPKPALPLRREWNSASA